MALRLTESVVEQAALAWLERIGYLALSGPDISCGKGHKGCGKFPTLAALRDTLLPKLISGEMRVPNPERTVARTV